MTQKNYHIGVLKDLKSAIRTAWGSGAEIEKTEICNALNAAIKALEQYPILDEIRAEIEKMQKMCDKNDLNLMAQYSAFGMVLDILDKYKEKTDEEKR